ncbi:MAG: ABC transporter ATP-binding protein [Isosphaeraceae bacterium]|nr:ABC transporter ATP-binding protein [Isosphaeraceae bacterium]
MTELEPKPSVLSPRPAVTPAVQVRDLSYRYPDGRLALRGVDLTIMPGECVALVGPNGAGKSTLLWHLNGLLPGRGQAQPVHTHGLATPDRNGQVPAVWIDGLEVNERNTPEVRRRVGLLFQDPDDQLFSTTVLEDVAFGPLNLGKSKAEARRIAIDCLARVDLADVADRMPHHLSFGERKRVCLAGVLACEPSVLVLDEPTANLDPRGRRRFLSLIRSLPATKLIATHDLEMVLELCPRTILLDGGRVVANGLTRNVLGDPNLLEAHGLEMPLSLQIGRPPSLSGASPAPIGPGPRD